MNKKHKFFRSGKVSVYATIIVLSIIIGGAIYWLITLPDNTSKYKDEAINNCISACKTEIAKGTILNSGPCLSNNIATDWACDIVSNPRNKLIDDLPDNQCKDYRSGKVRHFVEITPECNYVRSN
jgi:hypothetical protein